MVLSDAEDWIAMLYVESSDLPPFQVRWTEDVLAELLYHLRRRHPDWAGSRISGIRDKVVEIFEVGRVADFSIGDDYRGTDALDAHVHAAAVACGADILLTCDVKDFAWDENTSPYEVLTPDEFFELINEAAPELVASVTVKMCAYWVRRAEAADLPRALRAAGCPQFAELVRGHVRRAHG